MKENGKGRRKRREKRREGSCFYFCCLHSLPFGLLRFPQRPFIAACDLVGINAACNKHVCFCPLAFTLSNGSDNRYKEENGKEKKMEKREIEWEGETRKVERVR